MWRYVRRRGSSAAVVRAALAGGDVVDVGDETGRGVRTTHYRVTIDDAGRAALAALPANQRAWFRLQDLRADRLDVWVAGDLIRRLHIRVEEDDSDTTVDYFDFGWTTGGT